ncbi:SPFH domain-containing protein [Caulobacter sp. HMWF009]|uniref:SPFH domain-containing protein n=1 Tax=unclassified Caulobacter TaxID=2648921 RepID=UPI000D34AC2D|nr:stomatin/prohibitin-like protein [Caulobacter sp. HMWF009]PTT08708.1 stomatin/prohibitin-like protein [Caulobacter sp. HMWF025]
MVSDIEHSPIGKPGKPAPTANPAAVRRILIGSVVGFFLLVGGCQVIGHSTTVEPGNVGVKIRTLGAGAGVSPEALPARWYLRGIGERIVQYPVIQRTYSYTREKDERGNENEEITFSDNTGLPMTADVSVTMQVNPASAPALYQTYRLTFDQLLDGPIRNDVRSAVAAEAERVGVETLYSGGRQMVIQKAYARVAGKWAKHGVNVSQLDWIGSIRYPTAVIDQMQRKTQLEQEALAAKALEAKETALANAAVARAKGEAEAIRIKGEALRSNPQVLQQQAIEKWDGVLPKVTGGSTPFIKID